MDLLTALVILGGGYLLLSSRKSAAPVSPSSPNSQQSAATPEVPVLTSPESAAPISSFVPVPEVIGALYSPISGYVYQDPESGETYPVSEKFVEDMAKQQENEAIISQINFSPSPGSVPPFSINELSIPPIPAGSERQMMENIQSLIDRGYTKQGVQNYINSWFAPAQDRSGEPVLMASVPGAPQVNMYLHAGEKIPAGTQFVITNPSGWIDWIGQEYYYLDEHSYANPPNWIENLKRLGIQI